MIVSGAQLAELYGVDRRTVTNWLNEDPSCPSKQGKAGKAREFDTAQVAKWHAERAARRALAEKPKEAEGIVEAERRKAVADADIAEAKRDQLRGELVSHADSVREMERLCAMVRVRVMSVRGRWAPRIVGLATMAEAATVLDEMANDILKALSDGADDLESEEEAA